jgi:hypothetical protein
MRAEADDDVLGVVGLQLEEVAVVHHLEDQFLDVVGLVGVVGHQRVQAPGPGARRVAARAHRRLLLVVQRQVVEEAAQHQERLDVVLEGQVGHAALGVVRGGAAQLLGRHLLVRHGLHHLGAGDEHVAAVLHHEDEVGHRRRVHRAAGAGAHDQADLRDHAAGHHVALEDVGITAQRGHTFLDARAAAVVQADDRRADLHRLVHHLADLLGMGLAQGAAEDGEVLAEDEHQAAVDHAVAGDHAVARDLVVGHAEVGTAVLDEHVPFLEGAFVQQQFEPFARGQLALGVLRVDALLPTAQAGLGALALELFDDVVHGVLSPRSMAASGRAGGVAATEAARRPARTSSVSAGSCLAHGGVALKTLAQAGFDAFPHPGLVLLLAARGQAAVGRLQARKRAPRPRRPPARAAFSALICSTCGCHTVSSWCRWSGCRAGRTAQRAVICARARVAAASSRSALLITTRSASSITPFLMACRSSPALGSCSRQNMSVMPADRGFALAHAHGLDDHHVVPAASQTSIDSRVFSATPPSVPLLGLGRM